MRSTMVGLFGACVVAFLGTVALASDAQSLADVGGTADLAARIAALEERQDAIDSSAGQSCIGSDFFRGRCRTSGFYGGAEIMWLKPFGTGNIVSRPLEISSADEFLPAWRLWGGAQNCDGLGWRINWWQWDQISTGVSTGQFSTNPGNTWTNRTVFQKLDLLATQMVSFRSWDLMLLGGVTYAGNAFNTVEVGPSSSDINNYRFDGWGLTAGLLAYRDVPWITGLKGFGGVQWSGLYGNAIQDSGQIIPAIPFNGVERTVINSVLLNVVELKVGVQYERHIGGGAIGFLSTGFESQFWGGVPVTQYDNWGNLGLVGFTFGAGIRR